MKKNILLLFSALCLFLVACNNDKKEATESMTKGESIMTSKEERNRKTAMASIEAVGKGDWDAVFKDVAPSFVDYLDGTVPPMSNLDTLKAFIKEYIGAFEGYKAENVMYYADGDHVLVHGEWGGIFKNDLMGIKATGKPVKFQDIDILKFNEEGKITEHRSIQNVAAVLMTAGAMK